MIRSIGLAMIACTVCASAHAQTGDRARYTQLAIEGSRMVLQGRICDGRLGTNHHATLAENEFSIALAHSTHGGEHPEEQMRSFTAALPTVAQAADQYQSVQVSEAICTDAILRSSRGLYLAASELYLSAGAPERSAADFRERQLRDTQERRVP